MKNEKLDEFLYKNRLKSSDLVEFWGVTKGVVSQILNGTTKLPTKRLEELLNNPYGWDVSMLTDHARDSKPELVAEHKPQLSNVEILLRDMLAEKEAKIDVLQERINELIEENARLKTLIEGERKGGVA
jgi:plasmid maintenance system antidote protein VapI